jgi:hypothetical protein
MNKRRCIIQWKQTNKSAAILQIYSRGLEYALVSKNHEQCHPFVFCKDFLHDVLYSTINQKPITIYKFDFDPTKDSLPCLDKIRLLITNTKDKKLVKKIPAVLDFVNQIEESLKIKKSIVRICENPPEAYGSGVFLFEGSKRWLQSPPMLSLYSLLLRVGFCHTIGDSFSKTLDGIESGIIKPYQKKDSHWLKKSNLALSKIMRIGDRRIFNRDMRLNYPSWLDVDSVHNRLGIIGFSADILYNAIGEPVLVPDWHHQL